VVSAYLSPDLKLRSPAVAGGQARTRTPNSAAEGSVQYDPQTGRQLGRLIVQGTPLAQERRRETQADLYAQIYGGRGADFFPVFDESGLNVSNDYRTLSPEQTIQLRQNGFVPLGGSQLYSGSEALAGTPFGPQGPGESSSSTSPASGRTWLYVGLAVLAGILLLRRGG
jgi:hypothetical protein